MALRGVKIKFNGVTKHTGTDFDMVQEVKNIDMPEVQSYKVEVPGRNGLVNLTSALTGRVTYKNRPIHLEYFRDGPRYQRANLKNQLSVYHGQTVEIHDDDLITHHYVGECSVSYEDYPAYMRVIIDIDAYPFQIKNTATSTAINLTDTPRTLTVPNYGNIAVVPTVKVPANANAVIVQNDKTYQLSPGNYTIPDLMLEPGNNSFTVSGSGTIYIQRLEEMI